MKNPRGSGTRAPSALKLIRSRGAFSGEGEVKVAEITPGSARSCARAELRTFSFAAGETNRRSGALQLNWTRPAGSKPHASLISRSKYYVAVILAVRSPA